MKKDEKRTGRPGPGTTQDEQLLRVPGQTSLRTRIHGACSESWASLSKVSMNSRL